MLTNRVFVIKVCKVYSLTVKYRDPAPSHTISPFPLKKVKVSVNVKVKVKVEVEVKVNVKVKVEVEVSVKVNVNVTEGYTVSIKLRSALENSRRPMNIVTTRHPRQ